MKKPFYVAFAAALALLSGCIVYQMDKTPPCDGLSDAAKAECKFKPKCLLSCETKYKIPVNGFGVELPNAHVYGSWAVAAIATQQKGAIFDAVGGSGRFILCREDDSRVLSKEDVRVKVTCNYDYAGDTLGQMGTVFTLGLAPGTHLNHEFSFAVLVVNGQGLEREYRFKETIRERGGLLGVFAMSSPEYGGSYESVFEDVHRKIMNHVLVKMQQDGFFSAEVRDDAAAAKVDAAETLKKNAAARRKELEDLKKAGIIDETEYAAEVKKLEGAGT